MTGRRLVPLTVALLFSIASVVGCSKESNDSLRSSATNLATDASNAGDTAGARTAAEAYRGLVKTKMSGKSARTMTVLEEAKSQTPGGATFAGITDGNGDGLDDDGYVQVTVGGKSACVVLPESGGDTNVKSDPCPAA